MSGPARTPTQPVGTGFPPQAPAAVRPGADRPPASPGAPSRWRRGALGAWVALALVGGPARAEDGGEAVVEPAPEERALSAEDQEAVDNLELLESLEAVDQLDLLLELSKEEG